MIGIASPLTGWAAPLDAVPDPVFAERMLGDGIAIDPVEGRLIAPADGMVQSVHPAGHALTLVLDSGPVLLIHVGLDTVALGGDGFEPKVAEGQRISAGDLLLEFDLDRLARRVRSLLTPVILTNRAQFRLVSAAPEGPVEEGGELLLVAATDQGVAGCPDAACEVSRAVRIPLAHGLHARPAARIARAIVELDAQARIVASDGRSASARSPVAMLGLGLVHGAETAVRASGPDAERAVAVIAELLESGMGEGLPPTGLPADRAPAPAGPSEMPRELRGTAAVPGMASGPAWPLRQAEVAIAEDAGDPDRERSALAAARERIRSALTADAAGEGSAAAIAEAHLAMLVDPLLEEAADQAIAAGKSAGFAWRRAIRSFAAPLESARDARFAERLDDLMDLERRVLAELAGGPAEAAVPPADAIVLADTVYPSQLQALAGHGIGAIATAGGGATSHAAIIAAGLGIPMIVGLGPDLLRVGAGTALVLQDDRLVIAPDPAIFEQAREQRAGRARRRAAAHARAHEPAVTADGVRVEVFANLGSVAEAAAAVAQGAEGCGLLRTEFLFLERPAPPGEEEQREAYQAIADVLGERPLIVRTLDIGADKSVSWLPPGEEDNPALGLRGIRLQLARADLLETQFRALLGVRARKPLRIMLPMVSALAELQTAKTVLERLAADMGVGEPALGIMVETPAAALIAPALAAEAAFFSIGSNDLSQYALARDRTNPAVARGLDGLHPAVLRLIDETARGAAAHRRITGVCGGLAALPEAIPILLGLGVTELSVPGAAIAEVKATVRSLDFERCRSCAGAALAASDGDAVRALARSLVEAQS